MAAVEGLAKGPNPQQLRWVAFPSTQGQVVAKVLGPADRDHLHCVPHSVCTRSGALQPRRSFQRIRTADVTPCRVRPAVAGPKPGERGPPASPAILLARDIASANLPAAEVGTKWPLTFERRPPTPLSSLSVATARRLHIYCGNPDLSAHLHGRRGWLPPLPKWHLLPCPFPLA